MTVGGMGFIPERLLMMMMMTAWPPSPAPAPQAPACLSRAGLVPLLVGQLKHGRAAGLEALLQLTALQLLAACVGTDPQQRLLCANLQGIAGVVGGGGRGGG